MPAFDKSAKVMGLGMPGGPAIESAAAMLVCGPLLHSRAQRLSAHFYGVALPDGVAGHDPYGEKEQRVGKKSVFDECADDVDDEAIAAAAAKLKV